MGPNSQFAGCVIGGSQTICHAPPEDFHRCKTNMGEFVRRIREEGISIHKEGEASLNKVSIANMGLL